MQLKYLICNSTQFWLALLPVKEAAQLYSRQLDAPTWIYRCQHHAFCQVPFHRLEADLWCLVCTCPSCLAQFCFALVCASGNFLIFKMFLFSLWTRLQRSLAPFAPWTSLMWLWWVGHLVWSQTCTWTRWCPWSRCLASQSLCGSVPSTFARALKWAFSSNCDSLRFKLAHAVGSTGRRSCASVNL